jgi:hypothetical protein
MEEARAEAQAETLADVEPKKKSHYLFVFCAAPLLTSILYRKVTLFKIFYIRKFYRRDPPRIRCRAAAPAVA